MRSKAKTTLSLIRRGTRPSATRSALASADPVPRDPGSGAPSVSRLLAVATLAALGTLFALASSAHAQNPLIYVSDGTFSPGGTISGVAVDSTSDNVYVTRQATGFIGIITAPGSVGKFGPTGAAGTPSSFGDSPMANSDYTGVAVDPLTQDVYALARGGTGQVRAFEPDGTALGAPFPVTVDSTTAVVVEVAADAAGDIYYPNPVEQSIERIDSDDGSVTELITGLNVPRDVAVDADGSIYVADQGDNVVAKFDSTGAFLSNLASGETNYSVDVNRATDEVLVGSTDAAGYHVTVHDDTGAQIDEFGRGLIGSNANNRVAANQQAGEGARAYVTNVGSSNVRIFTRIEAPDPPSATTDPATDVTHAAATLHGRVNPEGFEVSECRFEWGQTDSYGQTAPCVPGAAALGDGTEDVEVSADLGGLDPETTYHFRLVAANVGGSDEGADESFTTLALPDPPTASTAPATDVTHAAATLNGTVNPEGFVVDECEFEWGETDAYGETAPCDPEASELGDGTDDVAVSADLTGLDPSTTYHFRLVAANVGGSDEGDDESFTTLAASLPPSVTTDPASDVTNFAATLNGRVNPEGLAVDECEFEWGETDAYGETAPCDPEASELGDGTDDVAVSAAISGLDPGVGYHFRLVAANSNGESQGLDEAFATMAFPKGVVDDFGQGTLNQPEDVAVNEQTGRVYVVDRNNSQIRVFEPDGTLVTSFGSQGTGKGQFGSGNNGPRGIAIDQDTGRVYVSEAGSAADGNKRVQRFAADGTFERMWGYGVQNGANQFQICTAGLPSCQRGIGGNAPGQIGNTGSTQVLQIAVSQPDGNPSTGSIYLADPTNRRINEYDLAGNFLRALGWGVRTGANEFQTCTSATDCQGGLTTAGTEDGRFGGGEPRHVAVDANGILYASDVNLNQRVQRFDTTASSDAGIPMAAIGGDGPLLDARTQGLAVSGATGNLLVGRNPTGNVAETWVQEVATPGGATPTVILRHAEDEGWVGSSLIGGDGALGGLAADPASGDVYVTRLGANEVAVLNDAESATVSLDPPTNVTGTSATFRATINPNGAKTRYRFEYRPVGATSFDSIPTPEAVLPRDDFDVHVSEDAAGLLPDTDYEVRVAFEGYGPPDATGFESFSTPAVPPAITTRQAAPVGDTTARLQSQINPSNLETDYRFEWGQTDSYGNVAPAPDATLAAGTQDVVVTELLTDLDPETTYHFRIVADNGIGGMQTGPDQTFTTRATPAPDDDVDRAYELVSPADKVGGTGVGVHYTGPAAMAGNSGEGAWRGERFAVKGNWGSVLTDGAFSYASDYALAERASDQQGWQHHSPVTHPNHGGAAYRFVNMRSATPDLSRFSVSSNGGTLKPFPEMEHGWPGSAADPSFMVDWEGRWEMFAPLGFPGNVQNIPFPLYSDGGSLAFTTAAGAAFLRGMGGPGDPTLDRTVGRSAYAKRLDGPPIDFYRELPEVTHDPVGVCTGSGSNRTTLPSRQSDGTLGSRTCSSPAPARDWRLIDIRGEVTGGGTGSGGRQRKGVASADGSRLFFTSPDPGVSGANNPCTGTGEETACPPQLYLRQQPDPTGPATTRWISRAADGLFETQSASLTGPAFFEAASTDGSVVYFRTTAPLTADDPNRAEQVPGGVKEGSASDTSWDLYAYEVPEPGSDPADGTLTRVSAGPTGDGDCNVHVPPPTGNPSDGASLRFLSDDGRRAYFTCAAPLPGVPAPANGTITSPGGTPTSADQANLYLYDATKPQPERWRFVARLPRATNNTIAACATFGGPMETPLVDPAGRGRDIGVGLGQVVNCVRGTSDGSFIALFTGARLVADDPDAESFDLYAYDAEADELTRISAPQGGDGDPYACVTTGQPDAGKPCHGDPGVGPAISPVGGTDKSALGVVTNPADPGDRIAFFQSRSRLVPEHTDSSYQVYQWRNGELSLLTPGSSPTDGYMYKGNDETGQNVYFATLDSLTWQDFDAVADIYTARVGGGIPEPVAPPVCDVLGGDCQSAPTPPPPAPEPGIADPAPEAERPPAGDCNQLQRQARQATQRAKNLRQRAKNLRQRAKRQARRGNAQRAKRLRRRAKGRIQPRARNQRQRAQRLRTEAQECREAQQPRRVR